VIRAGAARTAAAPSGPTPAIVLEPADANPAGPAPSTTAAITPAAGAIPRFEFSPHNCFACGTLNTQGLGLVLHVERGRSWTELTLRPAFEGWEGIAHGGIIATILDEVMAWALVGADNWGVTARMSVDFRRPVPVGRPIRAEGLIARMRRRIVETTASLVDAETGELLATATGTYVAAGEARKRELRERYGYRLLPGTTSDAATTANDAATTASEAAPTPGPTPDQVDSATEGDPAAATVATPAGTRSR
jgi:acyl-coenzyme A thioesterase PaaI-like protein